MRRKRRNDPVFNRLEKKAAAKLAKQISPGAGLVFAGFGAAIFLANRMIPKIADDYPFSFIWDGRTHGNLTFGKHEYRRVRTAADLVRSQISHYKTWSGRIVAETLNQLVLMKDDKIVYDCINTAAVLIQLHLCLWAGRGKAGLKKIPARLALMLSGGYWFCTPDFTVTSLWTTGAANYSWPGILQSAFLLPYALHYQGRHVSMPKSVMALSGLLAGWSNEAGGGLALVMSAAAAAAEKKRGTLKSWMVPGIAGAVAGYALLMLAPGNFCRFRLEQEYSDILPTDLSDPSMVPVKDQYTLTMFKHYLKHSFSSVILRELPLQVPVAMYFLRKESRDAETTKFLLAMETASFAVPAILKFSPQFPKRAAYPGIIYAMTAAVKAADSLDLSVSAERKKPVRVLTAGAGAVLAVNYLASLFVDADVYMQTEEQISILRANKDQEVVTVPDIMISPFWSRLAGDRTIDEYIKGIVCFEEDPGDPYNMAAAAFHGVGALRAEIPEGHPYTRKDKAAVREQILMPVRNFWRRLKELAVGKRFYT